MNEYDFLAKAKDNMEEEKYHEVISLCNKALKINKNLPEAYDFRGNAKFELEEYDSALEDFNELIKREPNDAAHYYDRAWTHCKMCNYENAIIDMNEALKIKPNTSLYYYDKARFEYWDKRYKEAVADMTIGIKIKPTENKYIERGNSYMELEEYNLALSDYNSAIKINPESARAYSSRGLLYNTIDRFEYAENDFKKAIELCPDDTTAMIYLGFIKIQLGKKNAMSYFNKAIKINPCANNYYWRIRARQKILMREDSLKKLSDGKFVKYRNDEIFNEKQAKDDIKDLNKAIALNDKDTDYYAMRADRYDYLNECSKSIEDYNILIEFEPDRSFHYWARACAKYNIKKYQEAIKDIDKHIELIGGTNDDYVFYIRGLANYKSGNYNEAVSDFTKGIFDGTEHDLYYFRGLANYNLKNYKQSHYDLNKALELKPDIESDFDEKIPLLIKLFLKKNKNNISSIGLCRINDK